MAPSDFTPPYIYVGLYEAESHPPADHHVRAWRVLECECEVMEADLNRMRLGASCLADVTAMGARIVYEQAYERWAFATGRRPGLLESIGRCGTGWLG
jgi:hypothetical protein